MANGFFVEAQQTSQKPKNIKTHNQRLVVSLLQHCEAASATEISERISLSKTSTTRILNDLSEKKLVKAVGKGHSTMEGGKRPELFSLNKGHFSFIVVHFGVSSLELSLTDMRCGIIKTCSEEYEDRSDYPRCFSKMVRCIEAFYAEIESQKGKLACVVVGCQGIVDPATGTLCYTAHGSWGKDIPLRDELAAALSFETKIVVENVCRFAGYAELFLHPELSEELVFTITAENTAGGCVLDHGTLNIGANGFVGEVGHMTVEPSSEEACICGGRGCFEMMVSPKMLLGEVRCKIGQYPQSRLKQAVEDNTLCCKDIFAAADKGDSLACNLVDRSAKYFSMLVHNIILMCDPRIIVVQGLYADAGIYFAQRLRAMVMELPFFEIKRSLKIIYSPIPYFTSVFFGGTFFAVNQILSDDQLYW